MITDTPDSTKNKLGLDIYNYFEPSNYIPIVKPSDYEYGYITRYFVGKINYLNVYETNAKDYNVVNNGYYKKIKITWKVSGPEFNQYKGKMLLTTGVVDYNILRIQQAYLVFPQIQNVLNNPRQFWRGF